MIIDAHAHLARNPLDLDRIVESGRIGQAWLLDISFYRNLPQVEWATAEEVLEAARRYPGFFIPFGFLDLGLSGGEALVPLPGDPSPYIVFELKSPHRPGHIYLAVPGALPCKFTRPLFTHRSQTLRTSSLSAWILASRLRRRLF